MTARRLPAVVFAVRRRHVVAAAFDNVRAVVPGFDMGHDVRPGGMRGKAVRTPLDDVAEQSPGVRRRTAMALRNVGHPTVEGAGPQAGSAAFGRYLSDAGSGGT